jgi:hypothetical protein
MTCLDELWCLNRVRGVGFVYWVDTHFSSVAVQPG